MLCLCDSSHMNQVNISCLVSICMSVTSLLCCSSLMNNRFWYCTLVCYSKCFAARLLRKLNKRIMKQLSERQRYKLSMTLTYKLNNWFLKDHFFTDLNDPQIKEVKTLIGELSGRSSLYCSDPCLKRYLEARNWNVGKAKKMLEETLKWRSTFKPEEIRWVSHQTHLDSSQNLPS